jgi:exopolysaccharide biosynthesis polyprenyl glycosylphosphotransferase
MALQCVHDVYIINLTASISGQFFSLPQQAQAVSLGESKQQRILVIVDENKHAHYASMTESILNNVTGSDEVVPGLSIIGLLDQTIELVRTHHIDTVIILLPNSPELYQLIADLQALSLRILLAYSVVSPSEDDTTGPLSLIDLATCVLSRRQRLIKRGMDIVFTIPLIILSLPLMLLIALAVRLDSPGPVLFKQVRLGQHARPFSMYKFRSMRVGVTQGSPAMKRAHDPRVTRIGKFIRQTSLDEIPQLFNVIKGDMSLVGPRPELPAVVRDYYQSWQYARFTVPQGATGWWQINGRSSRPMHLHTDDDLYYIRHYSLLMDVRIMLRTIPVVIKQEGAF